MTRLGHLQTGICWLTVMLGLAVTSGHASAQSDDAVFVRQAVPGQVQPGKRFVVDITYRNTGASTWTKGQRIKLGSQGPQDNVIWRTNRQGLRNADRIAPGQEKTFPVEVWAPETPGVYSMQWRVVREGVQWFGQVSSLVNITVGSGSGGGGGGGSGGGGSPPSSGRQYLEQVFAGYQGWFSAPRDGSFNRWSHWNEGGPAPAAGRVTFELYPDVREYRGRDLYRTHLGALRNGAPAKLFASSRPRVVDTHFSWMREYGIDGVALQRFLRGLQDRDVKLWRNDVALKVRSAAERFGRSFYVMYDITNASPDRWVAQIQFDWERQIEQRLQLTRSGAYARQDGRPVVGLWGLGFVDRPGTIPQALELIRWFKDRGVYVVGGVPYYWRDAIRDSKGGWQQVYLSLDVILPWSVGRYRTDADLEHHHNDFAIPDRNHARAHGVQYQRVIYPGKAWSNWMPGPRNEVPRRGGDFLWRQAYYARLGEVGAFIAMFDEYDEATAIAKAAETPSQIPHDQYFLTLDADGFALPSDHYLWLSGQATRMIRGEIPASFSRPNR